MLKLVTLHLQGNGSHRRLWTLRAALSKELPDFYVEESRGRDAGEETAGMLVTGPLRWTVGIRGKGQV